MSKNCVMIEVIYGNETLFNWFDDQIIFKKKDENEEYDQQSKLAQQYARLDPSALNSAMDESKHFQVKKDPFNSVWWQIFNFYWIKNDHVMQGLNRAKLFFSANKQFFTFYALRLGHFINL